VLYLLGVSQFVGYSEALISLKLGKEGLSFSYTRFIHC
jgi:hypothetical protein